MASGASGYNLTMPTTQQKFGFDNERYLAEQTAAILERAASSDNKLYLEFGGKLLFDMHASRVLPGFDPCVKMRLLQNLKDKSDIILCIFAGDIERKKIRADFGITYDADAVKLIDDLKDWGIAVAAVVITRFENQPAASIVKNKLERRGIRIYTHKVIRGYPADVERIVSDEGYGQNAYIETDKPLAVVTGPGPNSGKLSTCLSQLYHEYRRGSKAGYAKFETFPIRYCLPIPPGPWVMRRGRSRFATSATAEKPIRPMEKEWPTRWASRSAKFLNRNYNPRTTASGGRGGRPVRSDRSEGSISSPPFPPRGPSYDDANRHR